MSSGKSARQRKIGECQGRSIGRSSQTIHETGQNQRTSQFTRLLFSEIFPEDRFCSWAVGEVHILDEQVVPNGRRDAFETSMHLDHLITHPRLVGAEIARECLLASQKRHRRRTIELGVDKVYEKLEVIKQGAVSAGYAKATEDEIHEVLLEMKTATDFQLFKQAERRALRSQLKAVTAAVGTATKRLSSRRS